MPAFTRKQTARYALKREVAALSWGKPVFPWSMSDFKPGEQKHCNHVREEPEYGASLLGFSLNWRRRETAGRWMAPEA